MTGVSVERFVHFLLESLAGRRTMRQEVDCVREGACRRVHRAEHQRVRLVPDLRVVREAPVDDAEVAGADEVRDHVLAVVVGIAGSLDGPVGLIVEGPSCSARS